MKSILNINYPQKFIFSVEKYEIVNGKMTVNTYGTKPVKISNHATLEYAINKLATQFNVNPTKIGYKIVE